MLTTLSGCLADIRDQLDACTAAANITYPSDKFIPMGQPYKDIVLCMEDNGYVLEYTLTCKDRDYTAVIGDPYCYRPSGVIGGYIHDVTSTLR